MYAVPRPVSPLIPCRSVVEVTGVGRHAGQFALYVEGFPTFIRCLDRNGVPFTLVFGEGVHVMGDISPEAAEILNLNSSRGGLGQWSRAVPDPRRPCGHAYYTRTPYRLEK